MLTDLTQRFIHSNEVRRHNNVLPYRMLFQHLKNIIGSIVTDDLLMTKIYLFRAATIDMDSVTNDDITRMTKSCMDAMQHTFYYTVASELRYINKFLMAQVKTGVIYTIPSKALNGFKEYLNIITRYGVSYNSEALANLSYNVKSENLSDSAEEQTPVAADDLLLFLNINENYLNKIDDKLENSNSYPLSIVDMCAYVIRHMLLICRMAIPEYRVFDGKENAHELWDSFEKDLNDPYFGYDTVNTKYTLEVNHVVMLNRAILDRKYFNDVKFSDDAALAYVIGLKLHRHIDIFMKSVEAIDVN